jgi:hypothetical protein
MITTLMTAAILLSAGFLDETFQKAADAYEHDDYATSVQLYEQLVAEGVVSPVVFHNLGNAYYRLGMVGPAIANYERALQLDPGMQNARHNLDQCVHQTEMRMERPLPPVWEQSLLFWHYGLPRRVTSGVALGCWVLFWALLALRQFRPSRYLRLAAALSFILAIAFGVSAWNKAHPALLAVASRPVVPVYHGTSADEVVRFQLHEGDRVTVNRREQGWTRVATADGEWGWTPDEGLTFVGPPYERASVSDDANTPKEPHDAPE